MRFTLFLALFTSLSTTLFAQRLVSGEKAPRMVSVESVFGNHPTKGNPVLLEFFMVNSSQVDSQIETITELSRRHDGVLDIIMISKDELSDIRRLFDGTTPKFIVLHDMTGKVFTDYGVRYVPFSVLIDKKGNYIWQGRSNNIPPQVINSAINE